MPVGLIVQYEGYRAEVRNRVLGVPIFAQTQPILATVGHSLRQYIVSLIGGPLHPAIPSPTKSCGFRFQRSNHHLDKRPTVFLRGLRPRLVGNLYD